MLTRATGQQSDDHRAQPHRLTDGLRIRMKMTHITSNWTANFERDARMLQYARESMVRLYAYSLSEHRGFAPGHEIDGWLAAERQLRMMESLCTTLWNRQPRY